MKIQISGQLAQMEIYLQSFFGKKYQLDNSRVMVQ